MTEKRIKAQIILKHDTEAVWEGKTDFIPKQGEVIVYDKDENYSYERMKIGDGETNINELNFTGANNYVTAGKMPDSEIGECSTAEGFYTVSSGYCSHAEGYCSTAEGDNGAHAEGNETIASGEASHAEGNNTLASGNYSHAEGNGTIASGRVSHVSGKFNIEDNESKYAEIVGNGRNYENRGNARTLDWEGNAWYAGKVTVGSEPVEDMDLATKKYVDDKFGDSSTSGGSIDFATIEEVQEYLAIPIPDITGEVF